MTAVPRPGRVSLLVAAVAVLLTGCGPDAGLDLRMRSVAVTVPRLVTPAVELVPAAPAPPPAPLPPLALPPPPPAVSFPRVEQVATAQPAAPEGPACPPAGQLDVPDLPENPLISRPPAPGTSVQAATGSFSSTTARTSLDGEVVTRTVALPPSTSAVGQRVDSWRIERLDPSGGTSVEAYQLVHPSADALAVPPGIYLVGMAWKDTRGELTFEPAGLGLQILPIPVELSAEGGAQYVGSATDPDTLTTLSLVRNVTGRKRVDLCGELVETFTVAMTGVLTAPGSQRQVAWTQQLASAYGAANVEESLTLTDPSGGSTWTRGLTWRRVPDVPKETS